MMTTEPPHHTSNKTQPPPEQEETSNNMHTQIKEDYSIEERKNWYGSTADAYNRVRPRYPPELIHRLLNIAQLPDAAKLLEIGCGPGTATTSFAELGYKLVGLEPSSESCRIAQDNCAKYNGCEIINTTFEEWQLPNDDASKFDGVLSATAFHWVDANVRYQKTANALKENGILMLLWNTPPHPTADSQQQVLQVINQVHDQFAPSSLRRIDDLETHQKNITKFETDVVESELFEKLESEYLVVNVTYSIDDYIALLSTLSQYIMLQPQQRDLLFHELRQALEKVLLEKENKMLHLSHLSVFQVFKKKITSQKYE